MYFIIVATGATLFQAGHNHITSAAEAAEALRPLAGDGAAILLARGLVASGFLAVPVSTGSSAYAVADTLGWSSGLSRKPQDARGFYAVIVAGTLFGMLFNSRHQSNRRAVLDRGPQRLSGSAAVGVGDACGARPGHHGADR